jgi:cyclophilin family peptidyl-prolyl cis-trans isomerase
MKTLMMLVLILPLTVAVVFAGPLVEMRTSMGTIRIELNDEKAPVSVANFLSYVDEDHFSGTIFHRIIDGFMIQGGGYDGSLQRKATKPAIKNEATNGLKNLKGTLAMARTNDVDSATSQFFINLEDNAFLDNRGSSNRTYGYAVFGKVVDGMDVVERIAKLKVVNKGTFKNYPAQPVVIESVKRLE